MKETSFAMHRVLPGTVHADAVEKVTEALKSEGFGVLTSIDVRATMKAKLDADFKPYVILGACNPNMALQVLNIDDNVGLFMPCNVVVSEVEGGAEVGIASPLAMLGLGAEEAARPLMAEAEAGLRRVLEKL